MSQFEVLKVNYNHNHLDCSSNCSIHQAALDTSDCRSKDPINNWGDYWSISSGRSNEKIAHSAQHWSDCFVLMCPVPEDDKIMNKVCAGELESSPPLNDPQQRAMQDAMDPEIDQETILSPRPRPHLSKIKRRLHEALGCTTTNVPCECPECRCTKPPDPHLPSPSKEGHLPPTMLFQLLNHQSNPTTTETSTRYTMILQKRRKARLPGGKE